MWLTLTSIQILGIGNQCLCLLVGMPLILGMIDFERHGGDPMKRNLIDMVCNQGWHWCNHKMSNVFWIAVVYLWLGIPAHNLLDKWTTSHMEYRDWLTESNIGICFSFCTHDIQAQAQLSPGRGLDSENVNRVDLEASTANARGLLCHLPTNPQYCHRILVFMDPLPHWRKRASYCQ